MSVVVMVTMADRVDLLNGFLRSLAEHQPGHKVFMHVQGDREQWESQVEIPGAINQWEAMFSPDGLGCHAARVLALREIAGEGSYINVDDDVYLLPQTNWKPAITKAAQPGVGFVLTNWVRHPNLLEKRIPLMEDTFVAQAMVYQGGGMAYGEDVATLMRGLDPVPARYDDIWPLTAYLAGYRNYRYLGSQAVHTIMGKGGMNAYMHAEPRPLLCQRWINYRHLPGQPVGRDYSIPMDSDLKPSAKAAHKQARADRGWV